MSSDTRTRRLTSARPARAALGVRPVPDIRDLSSLLADAARLTDVLPQLHQQAVERTGGACSVLFEYNPRTGAMHATSGFGMDELRAEPWPEGAHEMDVVHRAFARGSATLVRDAARQTPDLAGRLGTAAALMIPLVQDRRRLGMLVVGFTAPPDAPPPAAAAVAGMCVTTLELFRLRQKDELQRDLRALADEFMSTLSATLDLSAGLHVFCRGANRLFAADRTSVWLHERRAKRLRLRASSDAAHAAISSAVPADDPLTPAAGAMRHARAEIVHPLSGSATTTITVPLRGCRRALGTILFEGVRMPAGSELDLLDRADEVGRQLSTAIENVQLLEYAITSRGGITPMSALSLTPQARLEVEREELRKRLTQSEKLAALGQLVAGIAHELNNPLQSVLGHLELLRRTGAFPKSLRRDVTTVYREADRAAKIVRNLLVFAGSRRLTRRPVSLTGILQKVVATRHEACRAQDIEVVRHYEQSLPRVQSDPLLLHQVFLNMVMNAEQAISATGRPGRIEIAVHARGASIVATVRDTGDGIPADALPRIFEPFYTTKEVGKGTGLGLAIAYGVVQEHGGRISASNHPDGGAVFTVELPLGGQAAHASTPRLETR